MKFLLFPLSILVFFLGASIGVEGKVITLFEDDDSFISQLSRQDTATNIENEKKDVFYGEIAIKVSAPQGSAANNVQRYNPRIPDWNYKIVENPSKEDEARWIMFAWKKIGGNLYLQFFAQDSIGRPDQEIERSQQRLKKALEKIPEFEVPEIRSALVFSDEKAVVEAENAPVPTLHARQLKKLIRKEAKGEANLPTPVVKTVQDYLGLESIT